MSVDRYQRAVQALSQSKRAVTLRSVSEWLREHDGKGCSLRDAHLAVSTWRAARTHKVVRTVARVSSVVQRELRPLDTDTRARVVRALSEAPPWSK